MAGNVETPGPGINLFVDNNSPSSVATGPYGDFRIEDFMTNFAPAAVYPNGDAYSVATEDFDGDCIADIALPGPDVKIMKGVGDGTFQQAQVINGGAFALDIVSEDFNGDSHPDLVTADAGGTDIYILMNDGNGVFLPKAGYNILTPGGLLVSGDLNNDGKPDLVASTYQTFKLLMNNGDGTFTIGAYESPVRNMYNLLAGDFNNDGYDDVVTRDEIYINNQDGTFLPPVSLVTGGSNSSDFAAGDFDLDGNLDLAVGDVYEGQYGGVRILFGDGTGTLAPGVQVSPVASGVIAADDFDRDGIPDLAVPGGILRGLGDGSFVQDGGFTVSGSPANMITGEFNGDGMPDIAVVNYDLNVLLSEKAYAQMITGTASDGTGSGVEKVEVSTDGGATWALVDGAESWSYRWSIPAPGAYNIMSRATDLAGHVETPGPGVSVTAQDNVAPTVDAGPQNDVMPVAAPYNIAFTVTDSDSETVDVSFYYRSLQDVCGRDRQLIGAVTVNPVNGVYSGEYAWGWTSLGAGSYKVVAEATDGVNFVKDESAGSLIVAEGYDGCTGYTNADYARYGPAGSDQDSDGLTNCQEVVSGTAPDDADTDNGGVRDGIETGLGTNPLVAADDSSGGTQSLVGIWYNLAPATTWKTWYVFKNIDPVASFVDITIYDCYHGDPLTTKTIQVPPNGLAFVNPASYPEVYPANITGSMEARAAGGRCIGVTNQEKWNYAVPSMLEASFSTEMVPETEAKTYLYGSWWNESPGVWDTWYAIKNLSPDPKTVRAEFYAYAWTGTPVATVDHVMAGKACWPFTPNAYTTVASGNVVVSVLSGGGDSIVGLESLIHTNQSDTSRHDSSYAVVMKGKTTQASPPVDETMTSFNLVQWSVKNSGPNSDTWMILTNPGASTSTVNYTFYNPDGSVLAQRQNVNILPKQSKTLSPRNINPEIGWTQEHGSVEITATQGIAAVGSETIYNSETSTVADYILGVNLTPTPLSAVTLYAPYLRKDYEDYDGKVVLKNTASTAVNVDIEFYSADGVLVETDEISVAGKALATVSMGDYQFGSGEYSLKIMPKTLNDIGLIGYFINIREDVANANGNGSMKNEGIIGGNLQRAP